MLCLLIKSDSTVKRARYSGKRSFERESLQKMNTDHEQYPTDREALERDCEMDFFIASGPGGQHRNKVETGVRLTHRPSGLVVTATERRSQFANREMAFERMATRLQLRQQVVIPRTPTRPSKASRVRRLDAKRHIGAIKKLRATRPDGSA